MSPEIQKILALVEGIETRAELAEAAADEANRDYAALKKKYDALLNQQPLPGEDPAPQPEPQQPGAYWQPAWLVPVQLPRVSGKTIYANPSQLKNQLANLSDGDTLLFPLDGARYDLNTLLGDALRITKNDIIVGSYGDGPAPVLFYSGPYQAVQLKGTRILFEGIDVETPYKRQGTSGIFVPGRHVTIRDVNFPTAGENCIRVERNGKQIVAERCRNTGKVAGYFAYSNGDDFSLIDCGSNKVDLAAFRCNECVRQYIAGGSYIGNGSGLSSRITLAEVTQAAVVGARVVDTELGTGPNMNKDGLRQAAGNTVQERHASLIAKKTADVDIRDVKLEGNARVELNWGTDGVRLKGIDNAKVKQVPDGTLDAEGSKWPLPGARNVVRV